MDQSKTTIPQELTKARSDVLDAFADLEHIVTQTARAWPTGLSAGATLGQKLEALSHLKASSCLSKDKLKILVDAIAGAQELCDSRNDIVHSRIRHAIGDVKVAVYINTRNAQPVARVMSLAEHSDLSKRTLDFAKAIEEWHHGPKK